MWEPKYDRSYKKEARTALPRKLSKICFHSQSFSATLIPRSFFVQISHADQQRRMTIDSRQLLKMSILKPALTYLNLFADRYFPIITKHFFRYHSNHMQTLFQVSFPNNHNVYQMQRDARDAFVCFSFPTSSDHFFNDRSSLNEKSWTSWHPCDDVLTVTPR